MPYSRQQRSVVDENGGDTAAGDHRVFVLQYRGGKLEGTKGGRLKLIVRDERAREVTNAAAQALCISMCALAVNERQGASQLSVTSGRSN